MGNQKSNLTKEITTKILQQEYGIFPNKIQEIDRGTANLFKIETEREKYILKEFSPKRTVESILKEVEIIHFLKERKINVPEYIKTKDKKFYVEHQERIIILQKFINGYTMENHTIDDHEKIMESARLLGKITKELKEYPKLDDQNIIKRQFSKDSIESGRIEMIELKREIKEDNPYKIQIRQDLEHKIKIAQEMGKSFDFNLLKKMTITNAHGDFSIQQFIYHDEGEITVIDFEKAKRIPIVWEVIRSYSYMDKEAKEGELNIHTLVEYFKEFMKYIDLNEYDLKYATHIYLIQLVRSTFGYKEYNKDNTQSKLLHFAFFRTKLCRYLYKNLEFISLELQKSLSGNGKYA